MKISFDEATGAAIVAAIQRAEWVEEVDLAAMLNDALDYAIAETRKLAQAINLAMPQFYATDNLGNVYLWNGQGFTVVPTDQR